MLLLLGQKSISRGTDFISLSQFFFSFSEEKLNLRKFSLKRTNKLAYVRGTVCPRPATVDLNHLDRYKNCNLFVNTVLTRSNRP